MSFLQNLPFNFPHLNLDSLVSALIVAVNSCSRISYLQVFHARVIKSVNYRHGFIGDQLVTNYAKLGYPDDAHNLLMKCITKIWSPGNL